MPTDRISLKKLKTSHAMSEETLAYTADVHLDNKPVLHASNRGLGGADRFHRHPTATTADLVALTQHARDTLTADGPSAIDIELYGDADSARARLAAYDDHTVLETLVARLIHAHDLERRIKRLCRNNIVLRDSSGDIYSLKGAYTPERAAAILKRYPNATILNPEHAP